MKTNFTKSDLKAGMAIELANEVVGVVMSADAEKGYLCFADDEGYDNLEYYNDDLTNKDFEDNDIVAVGDCVKGLDTKHILEALENPIWKREAKTETVNGSRITLEEFTSYIDSYVVYYKSLQQAKTILFGEGAEVSYAPNMDNFAMKYVEMLAKLLNITDEIMKDELTTWFFADECGESDYPLAFNRKKLSPAEAYKKITEN